ncbi:MAG: PorV/PorQ family protein [Elusimicrobia bacterium]|nr:PorV/PorQ family protein [Elusimicrobiota bacterium]
MKRIALVIGLIFVTATIRGEEGAAFLKLGTGARAAALGGAYTALGDDASAIGWNPAGLARLEKREFNAAHAELHERTRLDFATYAHPTGRGSFAAALLYLSHGSFTGRDAAGRPTGSVTASDAALTGAYAIKAGFADIGVGFKFITSHIAEAEARTTAVDLGLKKQVYELKGGKVFAAAAVRNLNPGDGLRYNGGQKTELPLQLAAGAAWAHEKGALSFDLFNGPYGSGTDAAFGGEYKVMTGFAFRAGYTTAGVAGGSGIDAARGLSFGVGVGKDGLSVDYAIVPSGDLGAAHRFGLGYRF